MYRKMIRNGYGKIREKFEEYFGEFNFLKFAKKVAAIGTGVAMLGATLTGALA